MGRAVRYNNGNRRNSYSSARYNNARYNYTTEAYSYAPELEIPEYTDLGQHSRKKNKKKARVVYTKAVKERPQNMYKILFTAVLLASFAVGMLAMNASNISKRNEILELNSTLKEVTEANTNLKTELTKNLNLDEVEKLASAKLGMQMPQSYQTVYINVPKEGYTVQYEDSKESEKGFDLKNVAAFLFKD